MWPCFVTNFFVIKPTSSSSSSSLGAAILVGFGLINYRWVFSARRFYRVPLLAVRQTPNLEDHWLERSNSRHKVSPASETTRENPSSGRWNYGREISENSAESGDFHFTFGFFYMPKIYNMGPTALLPLRRKACWGFFRPGLNPRTWVPKASTLTSIPPKQ